MAKASATEFLKVVLGEDGFSAFEKANQRMPTLGAALAPRTIVSWLHTAIRAQYEGEIPGLENSYIAIQKNEDGYTGALTVGDHVHSFESADVLHVAAAVALSLGLEDLRLDPMVKNTDISKLGKSIDLLVKARLVTQAVSEALQKNFQAPSTAESQNRLKIFAAIPKKPLGGAAPAGAGTTPAGPKALASPPKPPAGPGLASGVGTAPTATPSLPKPPSNAGSGKFPIQSTSDIKQRMSILSSVSGKNVAKTELPGKAAAPREPKAPDAPEVPQAVAPSTNKTTKPPMSKKELVVKKSDAEHACVECGIKQFRRERFVGCMCFRALAKSVTTKDHPEGYVLSFGTQWDEETIQTFMESLKG